MQILPRTAGSLLAVLLAWTTSTLAQIAPAPSPPSAQGSTDVPYPVDAHGDAVVLLELVIDREGSVVSAVVIEGSEPFAEQARRAVLAWRFVPAHRGDTSVAARIRARVEFREEPTPGGRSPSGTPAPTDGAHATRSGSDEGAQAAPEPPVEVTVRGNRHEIGQTTLLAADVREMPGAFGDPFRAIEALPGVTPW